MDELIKALRDSNCATKGMCGMCPKRDKPCIYRFASEAADAIEELQEDNAALNVTVSNLIEQIAELSKPKWIPVTERLPEEHVFVLVRQDDDRMMIAVRVDGNWWYRYFAYDVDRWDENEQGTITHWMPLPEPPKEET